LEFFLVVPGLGLGELGVDLLQFRGLAGLVKENLGDLRI
jgi:hypothetical protein